MRYYNAVLTLCQLDDGNILSGSTEHSISIWSIKELFYVMKYNIEKAHNLLVNNYIYIGNIISMIVNTFVYIFSMLSFIFKVFTFEEWIKLLEYFFLLFGCMIYNEIIILHFCGFERNTKKSK